MYIACKPNNEKAKETSHHSHVGGFSTSWAPRKATNLHTNKASSHVVIGAMQMGGSCKGLHLANPRFNGTCMHVHSRERERDVG